MFAQKKNVKNYETKLINEEKNIFRQPEMVCSFLPLNFTLSHFYFHTFTLSLSQQKTCSGSPRWSPPSTNCSWLSPSLTSSMSPQTLSTIPLLRFLYFTNIADCSIVKVPLLHKHWRLFHC